MPKQDHLRTEQDNHRKAFEMYYALGEKRSYRQVAQQLGVSLPTVKLWARAFGWRQRIRERDATVARKVADHAIQSNVRDGERNQKIVELALMKVAKAIAEGKVRIQLSDLDRILRLQEFLESRLDQRDPERPKTRDEFIQRYLHYFSSDEIRRMISLLKLCKDDTAAAAKINEFLKTIPTEEP